MLVAKNPKPLIPQIFLVYLRQIGSRSREITNFTVDSSTRSYQSGPASSPSLSIWRRKKEMSKEGLIAAKELKRLQTKLVRLDRFISSHVSRLLKSDLVSVLAEFQRQDQVFLCMKVKKKNPNFLKTNQFLNCDFWLKGSILLMGVKFI